MIEDIDHRERVDKVNRACLWWKANEALIKSLLPLRVNHPDSNGFSLYQHNFDIGVWITKWENQDRHFPLEEAERLIPEQLRPLFPIVRERLTNPG